MKLEDYKTIKIPDNIPQGDMPSDPVFIGEEMIYKANVLFNSLIHEINELNKDKIVIGIAGGSGVGKTCVASVITYYLNELGFGSYTMSGDNYPRRIPEYNDAERVHIFRESGIKALANHHLLTKENLNILHEYQKQEIDASYEKTSLHDFMKIYIDGGSEGLKNYLGTSHEIKFDEVNEILRTFKLGKSMIDLKRMGRTELDLWYEPVSFENKKFLVLEWTHALNEMLSEVDIPVLLNSTPQETLEYRKARGRDANTTSPFVSNVLQIEQRKLHHQAKNAKIIITKNAEVITYEEYKEKMKELD